tara:strand:- start:489 stop:629 length:141 start_codon:yes stop_codon:yes gene_type:complete
MSKIISERYKTEEEIKEMQKEGWKTVSLNKLNKKIKEKKNNKLNED